MDSDWKCSTFLEEKYPASFEEDACSVNSKQNFIKIFNFNKMNYH